MRLKTSLGFCLAFFLYSSSAQIQIGYYHDLDKLPIHDLIDPFQYSPDKKISITHYSDSYEQGKVYFTDGTINEGLIKFENKKIWFKKSKIDVKLKIKPEETVGLTIGLDSFFVATNFKVERYLASQVQEKPQFMQYLTSFAGKVFAKHYFFPSGFFGDTQLIETYLVREDGDTHWKSFPKNKGPFKNLAVSIFGHIPYLKEQIEDQSIDWGDMMTLIKSAEYFEKLKNEEPIYFDPYWNETDVTNASYQANIRSLENDSIWIIDYYKDSSRIYRARYYSLFPNKKHGLFETFDALGNTIFSIEYDKNDIKETTISFKGGRIHYSYQLQEMSPTYKPYTLATYEKVFSPEGKSLRQNGKWTEEVMWSQGTFTNLYDGNRLIQSYREEDGRKVYQIIDPKYKFQIKKLQGHLNAFFEENDFSEAAANQVQGTYFITLMISDRGEIVSYNLHNNLHGKLDSDIESWTKKDLEGSESLKFKPYKVDKKKVYAEFMVPIQFSIHKFYRKPSNYYYDWHFHQMMFQQQMMQPMNLPPPPPMPSGF